MAVVAVIGGAGLVACGSDSVPRTVEIVVPAGTAERIAAGEEVEVMPSLLEMQVGDTLVVRNEDSEQQAVGPYVVDAGEEMRLTYGTPGRFEGTCDLSGDGRYVIVVEE